LALFSLANACKSAGIPSAHDAALLAFKVDDLHTDEIDHTMELVLNLDWDLDGGGEHVELGPNMLDNTLEACSRTGDDVSTDVAG
jgi:hypothetical protein